MATTGANTADFTSTLDSEQSLAGSIFSMWTHWKSVKNLAESRWTETKKYVFATSTHDTTNAKNPWSNSSHRPKLYHIYNNLLVNTDFSLFPHRDWLEFIGNDDESNTKEKREAALAYLNTKHRLSNFKTVMRDLESDWILYGNAFAGIEYVTETSLDPISGEAIPAYVGPRPYRISPYDIVFNPKAVNFAHSPKIIRSRTTIGELERTLEEQPSLGYDPSVLQLMKDERLRRDSSESDGEKDASFVPDGFGSSGEYYFTGHTTLYEFYGDLYDQTTDTLLKNYLITVADGMHILRKQPMSTYSGTPNIFQVVWKQRPDNLWGFGPLDNIVGLQYRINHLENGRADAFDDMIDPDLVITGDVEPRKVGGATHYFVPEGGDVRHLVPDTTVLNADFQIQELEAAMELYANAPREALGIRSPGEKTAFEVNLLTNAANRGFEYQTSIFSDFLEKIVNAELEAAVNNLSTSDIVSVIDNDLGIEEFIRITREDLVSNGKVIPVGAREFARKSRLSQQLATFYQTGLTDPEVAQHFPAKKIAEMWAELLDFEDIFEPYGRIPERLEAASLQATAENMLAERQMIDPTGMSEDEVIPEEGVEAGGVVG